MNETDSVTGRPRPRRLTGLLAAILLAIICALIAVLTRDLWLTHHPAAAAARQMRDPEASRRITAIRDLERFGAEEPEIAIRALAAGLKDDAPGVRAAAALALVIPVHGARRRGAAATEVQRAVGALLERVKDSGGDVRAASLRALWMIASPWDGSAPAIEPARVFAELIQAATDPDAAVRIAALSGIGAIGPSVNEDPPALVTR